MVSRALDRLRFLLEVESAPFAGDNFNKGMRTYYLSMAALSWFLHPWLLIGTTALVILVLYRREFHSSTFLALMEDINLGEHEAVSP